MSKQVIYFIPGLGFDERIFNQLRLEHWEHRFINWLKPISDETIENYASRMASSISTNPNEQAILAGHSFGGVIAQEIAQQVPRVSLVLLLSSIKRKKEIPFGLKFLPRIGMVSLFNKKNTFRTFPFWAGIHGYNTAKQKQAFIDMVSTQDDYTLSWSLDRLANWQGQAKLAVPVIHIHGDRDRTFPIKSLDKPKHIIKNGSHVMPWDNAEEVSRIIDVELEGLKD